MGCGMSTLDPEDATTNRPSSLLRRYKIVRPVGDNNLATKKLLDGSEESFDSLAKQSRKSVSSQGNKDVVVVMKPPGEQEMKGKQEEKIKEKEVLEKQEAEKVINNGGKEEVGVKGGNEDHQNNEETEEEETGDREDYIFKGGSPSFRDYCVDLKPKVPSPRKKKVRGDPSFSEYFNDDSGESTKNEGDDDSTKTMNKPQKKEGSNSNKEPQKKERIGRGFRNAINKGRSGGKKNLLNFSCYSASHASYAEGSLNKIVGKAA